MMAFYVVSMVIVGSHLFHGISSSLQSLGISHPKWAPRFLLFGKVFASAMAIGFIAIALWAHFTSHHQGAAL
jgi:succinate dehydrogenase / fumarate reductase cytochrome b subunit